MTTLDDAKAAALAVATSLVSGVNAVNTATLAGKMDKSANLADVASVPSAKTNLAVPVTGSAAGQVPALDTDGDAIDAKGKVRRAPLRAVSANGGGLLATDSGKGVRLDTAVTSFSCDNTLSPGDLVTIVNRTAGGVSITQGAGVALTLMGGTSTGTRTLAQNGVCTVYCDAAGTYLIGGTGLS